MATERTCKKRGEWTQRQLEDGLKLLNEGYSQHQAAVLSGVPRRTLRNHIKSGSLEKTVGPRRTLNDEQELDLVARIIRFAEKGLPLTPLAVRRCVYQYCEKYNIPNQFNEKKRVAGKLICA